MLLIDSTAVGKAALIAVLLVPTVMLVVAVSLVASCDKVMLLIVSFVKLGTAISVALLEFPFMASGSNPVFVGYNTVV
jgi:hypothetical protein